MKYKLIVMIILLFNVISLMSNDIFQPISFDEDLKNIKQIDKIESIYTDVPEMDIINSYIDSLDNENIMHPEFYGYGFKYEKDLQTTGTWDTLKNGNMIWRYHVICPGAFSVNFVFEDFHISENAHISFYNEDKTSLLGPYTNRINKVNGKFSSHLIEGFSVFIELFVPFDEVDYNRFTLSKIVYGYKNITQTVEDNESKNNPTFQGIGDASSCNINVTCPEGDDWCREIYSVARIIFDYFGNHHAFCTGSLINNTENDYTPYFLTAFHCLDDDDNEIISQSEKDKLNNWSVQFGFYRQYCSAYGTMPTYEYHGADFRSGWSNTDFLLIELETQPQSGENNFRDVYFNGWDKSGQMPDNTTCLHHPALDWMKISQDYDSPDTYIAYHWVVDWDIGTTEGGSSGAPLYTDNKHVIGQVHGGIYPSGIYDPCHPDKLTTYGRFDLSWDGDGTSETRLKDWLDPNNKLGTNEHTWDGIKLPNLDYGWIITSGQSFTRYAYDVFKIGSSNTSTFRLESGGEFNMQAGKEIHIRPCTHFESGSEYHGFIEDIDCDDIVMLSDKESDYNPYNCGGTMLKQLMPNDMENEIANTQISIIPNPLSDITTITISLTNSSNITLAVFDMLGNKIHEFTNNEYVQAGRHRFTFNAANIPNGMYYVNLTSPAGVLTEPLIIAK